MKLSNKNILLISPEPWDHIFVSKHHYAIHLASRGNQVFFLNPPRKNFSIIQSGYKNLYIINYQGFIPGLRFLPKYFRRLNTRNVWKRLETLSKIKFDVIWSFDNSVFFDLDSLPKEVYKISHIVDLDQSFEMKKAARTANLCICTSRRIASKMDKFNVNTFQIPHGCNVPDRSSKIELPGQNEIKALYSGNLRMKFIDWNIIYDVAKRYPKVDFVFLGPGIEEYNRRNNTELSKVEILKLSNIYPLGKVSPDRLLDFYEAADFLFLAYQQAHHCDQSNPHKVMEYLLSGKPVVCTYTEEYEKLNFIYMSKENFDFVDLFDFVLNHLPELSTSELLDRRRQFALDNTYDKQISKIELIINRN